MTDQELRPDARPHPNPSPEGEGLSGRKKQTTLLDWAVTLDSPPLQGRGRGWGLSAGRNDEIADHARTMRNQPTAPEARLWSILSRSQLGGYKFRRQAAIGTAIADFLCPQKGLIVEVDGDTHTDPAADARRTARLAALGFRVVRVTNAEVMGNLEGVQAMLLDILEPMPDRRAPHPNPSPEAEGLKQDAAPSPSPSGEGLGVGPLGTEPRPLDGISLEGSVG